jgi:hypothetical protein
MDEGIHSSAPGSSTSPSQDGCENRELAGCKFARAMASMAARCASSALLGALEPLSTPSASSSTSAHAAAAFFPVRNGLEFVSQASVRGTRSLRSALGNVESRPGGGRRNFRGVRASSAGVMESAPPAAVEDPVVVSVDLGDRSYPIYIGAGLLDRPELLQKHVTGKKVRGCVGFFSGSF